MPQYTPAVGVVTRLAWCSVPTWGLESYSEWPAVSRGWKVRKGGCQPLRELCLQHDLPQEPCVWHLPSPPPLQGGISGAEPGGAGCLPAMASSGVLRLHATETLPSALLLAAEQILLGS